VISPSTSCPHFPFSHSPDQDEPFHAGQTAAYCAGRWSHWDPKITTPPGLYVLALGWARGVHAARRAASMLLPARFPPASTPAWGSAAACSLGVLRFVNVPLAAGGFAAATLVHRALHPKASADVAALTALAVALLPTHSFFTWLFYTDVAGLTLLLSAWALSLRRRYLLAGLVATAAAAVRQTHAVWAAPIALGALIAAADASRLPGTPRIADAGAGAARQAVALGRAVLARPGATLGSVWPLALPQAALLALTLWNGGVALGDKASHAAGAHAAQAVYAAAFVAAVLALPHLSRRSVRLALHDAGGPAGGHFARGVVGRAAGGWLALRAGLARPHPFLLADNRHYTFYAWRAYVRAGPGAVVGLALAAAGCGAGWVGALLRVGATAWGGGALWVAGLAATALAALVPAPLVEPRYWTPLAAYALLAAPPARPLRLAATVGVWVVMNAALVHVFLDRPFKASGGGVGRFMW